MLDSVAEGVTPSATVAAKNAVAPPRLHLRAQAVVGTSKIPSLCLHIFIHFLFYLLTFLLLLKLD